MSSKYRNRITFVDGQRFASAREARRYSDLKLIERAGEISGLKCQVSFDLHCGDVPIKIRSAGVPKGRQVRYVADFVYRERDGREVIEDCKGHRTDVYKLKRAIMEAMGHKILET